MSEARAISLTNAIVSQGTLQELEEAICATVRTAIADITPSGLTWTLSTRNQFATERAVPAAREISTYCTCRCRGPYTDTTLQNINKVLEQIAATIVTLRDGSDATLESEDLHIAGAQDEVVAYEATIRIKAVKEEQL